jgi:hypothetical protein
MIRSCVVLALVASLLNLASVSASERPLGMIVLANGAYLDKGTAGLGADVFAGDSMKTDPGGMLRLKLGSTQFYILSDSDASLSQNGNNVHAKIAQGTAGFSSAAAEQFEIETPIATIRAADGQRAFGQVTITGPQKMLVSAYRGDLVVERNGTARTIKAGEAYNVTYVPDPAPAAPPSGTPPQGAGSRGVNGQLIFDAVVIGGAVLAGILLYYYNSMSDSQPSN